MPYFLRVLLQWLALKLLSLVAGFAIGGGVYLALRSICSQQHIAPGSPQDLAPGFSFLAGLLAWRTAEWTLPQQRNFRQVFAFLLRFVAACLLTAGLGAGAFYVGTRNLGLEPGPLAVMLLVLSGGLVGAFHASFQPFPREGDPVCEGGCRGGCPACGKAAPLPVCVLCQREPKRYVFHFARFVTDETDAIHWITDHHKNWLRCAYCPAEYEFLACSHCGCLFSVQDDLYCLRSARRAA